MISAKVKQENGYNDETDDGSESEAESYESSQLKSEEDLYGEDTHDEDNDANQVIVEGCGSNRVNGKYTKASEFYDGAWVL